MKALLDARAHLFGALVLVLGCTDPSTLTPPPEPNATEAEDAGTDTNRPPDTGIGGTGLLVTRVVPGHGPFIGGNSAIVRGSGFVDGAVVTVGGRMVQPADTRVIDPNRLAIVLPAGEPGPADVTVSVDDAEATLPDGYLYDSIYVEPTRGATSGGTFVNIVGSSVGFEEGDRVTFGGSDCEDVEVVSGDRITCRTPPGAVSTVDVSVIRNDGSEITIEDGFEYFDSSDPFNGGLGGGPIEGTINVTVLNAGTGEPVDEAFVILGENTATEHQGLTNLLGQISFSGPDVVAPALITAAKFCFEKTSFVSFDARDVTIFLVPWQDPMCGMGGDPPPPGPGRNGSFVSGELVFLGPNELGPNPWDIVPPPREGWERVSYVYTTQPCAGDDFGCLSPDPGLGGGQPRVLETPLGSRGYPFRIFVRPAAFAVYAMAGLENRTTGEFLPYVMGVARNILVGPGDEVENVEIIMNIPLDHFLDVELADIPGPGRTGPDRFVASADIDLGGEGLIVRRVANARIDVVRQRGTERPFRFFAQPALLGALEDGRYRVETSWVTGDFDADPSTHRVRNGIREVDTVITVGEFLGVPVATSPGFGERIPSDRVLRWETDGGETPDFHLVLIIGGDGNPAWRMFVRGDQQEAPIPNLETIPGINDISRGFITWAVFAISIPGFDFNEVSYADLNDRAWSAWAIDVFTAQR
ncbi:MAG: IPT/TIG domain-containing protein [Myxococcota bacterium]